MKAFVPPIVECSLLEDSVQLIVCPYCGESHYHGTGLGGKQPEDRRQSFGHRVAHCSSEKLLVDNSAGYYLVWDGKRKGDQRKALRKARRSGLLPIVKLSHSPFEGFAARDLNLQMESLREKAKIDRLVFAPTWVKKGWHAESSDVIRRVLLNCDGELSGTTRLVRWGNIVCELYLDPLGTRPVVVAVYVGTEM